MRRTPPIVLLCLGAMILAPMAARAQDRAYCHVTSIESKRLANAVQVTIRADGLMQPDIWSYELFNVAAGRMGLWDQMAKRVPAIPITIRNARSKVGSIADVGIYPVSHVEVSIPPDASEGIGLLLRVVLHTPGITREVRLPGDRYSVYAPDLEPPFISIEMSQDRRSIVLLVTSDRRTPEPVVRRRLGEGAPAQLNVACRSGLLTVDACGADLRETVREIGRLTGQSITIDPALERSVSMRLDDVKVDDAVDAIAVAYGLTVDRRGGRVKMADLASGAAAFSGTEVALVQLHHVTAATARNCLPDALLDQVRVDPGHNALSVSGPPELVSKVRSDLAMLDTPVPLIEVVAAAVEFAGSEDLEAFVRARASWGGGEASWDSDAASITYGTMRVGPSEIGAALRAAGLASRSRIRAQQTTVVLLGRSARLFVGRRQYMAARYYDQWADDFATTVINVDVGASLTVTPRMMGPNAITASVRPEVGNISDVDPATGNPTLSTRSAETTVRVAAGDTLVIGGLDMDETAADSRRMVGSARRSATGRSRLAMLVTLRPVRNGFNDRPKTLE